MKELLQQALDALDAITDKIDGTGFSSSNEFSHCLDTIAALREALAAPMPEPVHQFRALGCSDWYDGHPDRTIAGPYETRMLYAAPPAAPAPAVPATFVVPGFAQWRDGSAAPVVPDGVPDTSLVICPNCCTQFRAIPQDVQRLMIDAGFEPPFVATPAQPLTDAAMIAAAPALVVPNLRHCACEFDGDTCVTQCKLHAAHVDAIHEWAERAKAAEAKLSAAPVVREPQDERDARIEALQTECDASNMEVIELTAEVAALRAEVANLTKIIDEAWGEA